VVAGGARGGRTARTSSAYVFLAGLEEEGAGGEVRAGVVAGSAGRVGAGAGRARREGGVHTLGGGFCSIALLLLLPQRELLRTGEPCRGKNREAKRHGLSTTGARNKAQRRRCEGPSFSLFATPVGICWMGAWGAWAAAVSSNTQSSCAQVSMTRGGNEGGWQRQTAFRKM
jgi:hypothetical protein